MRLSCYIWNQIENAVICCYTSVMDVRKVQSSLLCLLPVVCVKLSGSDLSYTAFMLYSTSSLYFPLADMCVSDHMTAPDLFCWYSETFLKMLMRLQCSRPGSLHYVDWWYILKLGCTGRACIQRRVQLLLLAEACPVLPFWLHSLTGAEKQFSMEAVLMSKLLVFYASYIKSIFLQSYITVRSHICIRQQLQLQVQERIKRTKVRLKNPWMITDYLLSSGKHVLF